MPIVTQHSAMKTSFIELLVKRTNYTDWSNKIIIEDKTTLDERRRLFNQSVMYITQLDSSLRLIRVQKKLKIPGYSIVQRGFFRSLLCFKMNEEFQFIERVNDILHRIQSGGLYDLWFRQDDIELEKLIARKNLKRLSNEQSNTSESQTFPMFIAYGWLGSIILFFGEIIWFKIACNSRTTGHSTYSTFVGCFIRCFRPKYPTMF